jgi:predicted 3-demethylubiquinone-9 3-methyltransferase (glyoxalase superfamily)
LVQEANMPKPSAKIVPHLWYAKDAEEAAKFYASVFPDSHVDRVSKLQADSPSGPPGSVSIVEFTLCGQPFMALTAGPHHEFNDAVSFLVHCDTQAELDRYWNAILENGGKPQACGWIIDRYGLRWQISPTQLGEWLVDKDPVKAKRVADAMLKQVKFDIAALQAAYDGR